MAPRAAVACVVWMLVAPGLAHAQPCACPQTCDCAPNLAPPGEPNLIPPAPLVEPELEPPGSTELRAVQGTAIGAGLAAWILTTALAAQQTHFFTAVDSIPVVGGIASAVRNPSRDAPLLLFASSAQVMSILVAVVAGVELANERARWRVSVGGGCNGAGVMLGGTF